MKPTDHKNIKCDFGLKDYFPDKEFLPAFVNGLVFGNSTTRILEGMLDSILRKISKIGNRVDKIDPEKKMIIMKLL